MKKILFCVLAVMMMGSFSGCKSNSNRLVGTWNLNQPNPPVAGQSDKDCSYTKWVFTDKTSEAFIGDKSGGPDLVTFVTQGQTIFATGPINNIAFTFVGKDQMYWSAAYGRCYYTRG